MLTPVTESDVDQLVKAVRDVLGDDHAAWPGGWTQEVDTSIVDAGFSTRANYRTTVLPLVERYRTWNMRPPGGTAGSLAQADADALLAVTNRQRVPGRNSDRLLKAVAAKEVAANLAGADLDTAEQIVSAAHRDPRYVRAVIQRTVGVGPAQSSYLLMLLGVDGVKADSLVTAFVRRCVLDASTSQVESLVVQAAQRMKVRAIDLDHAIWRHESDARASNRRRS